MLAASAVAGTGQKLDLCAALQDDLFAAQGGADLGNIPAHFRPLEEGPHFLKGLGGGLLQVGRVDDRFVEHEHAGRRPPLHQQALAVLAGHAAARRGGSPFAGHGAAHPVVQDVALPRVQHRAACPQDAHGIRPVSGPVLRRDAFGRLLASHHFHALRGSRRSRRHRRSLLRSLQFPG